MKPHSLANFLGAKLIRLGQIWVANLGKVIKIKTKPKSCILRNIRFPTALI